MLHKDIDGKVKGALSPVMAGQEVEKQLGFRVDGLARLNFINDDILQRRDGNERHSRTYYDHLAILQRDKNDNCIGIIIDMGTGICPYAMKFQSEDEISITGISKKYEWLESFTMEELKKIFEFLFANLETIFNIPEKKAQINERSKI
jgi:hypothetical protein